MRKLRDDQKQSRIIFDLEDWEFIAQYQESNGCSFQFFVNQAIKDKIAALKAEQYLKDQNLKGK